MARYVGNNNILCVSTVLIALLASIAAGLSLEELNSKIQQLEQHNEKLAVKIHRLQLNEVSMRKMQQKLELKVRDLETKMIGQQKEKSRKSIHETVNKTANVVEQQPIRQRKTFSRTCRELSETDRMLRSGMYWIDPDGYGSSDPIYVHCDMETGKTSIAHDSESPTNVSHCATPGCYSKFIKYSAPVRQMAALAYLSKECHQSIKYDCNSAPLEVNGVAQSWWHDRNGVAQYFWSGNNNNVHRCQCGIDKNCVDSRRQCNCDSNSSIPLSDIGVITNKSYLPITRLNFGRSRSETSSGIHTLGRFECTGQVKVSGMPKSCSDLWKIGNILSGIYSVMGSEQVETVYCDFAKLHNERGFQTLIGYADVKSSPIYFYVQKNVSHVNGRLPFELTKLNVGGAMNAKSGIFTVPRNGIYSFDFSGVGEYHTPRKSEVSVLGVALMVNDSEVGRGLTRTHAQGNFSYYTISLHSTLELKATDEVWVSIASSLSSEAWLHDNEHHYTHFTGHLLQENMASSLGLL